MRASTQNTEQKIRTGQQKKRANSVPPRRTHKSAKFAALLFFFLYVRACAHSWSWQCVCHVRVEVSNCANACARTHTRTLRHAIYKLKPIENNVKQRAVRVRVCVPVGRLARLHGVACACVRAFLRVPVAAFFVCVCVCAQKCERSWARPKVRRRQRQRRRRVLCET